MLFGLSYDYVGDLSETVALMWPKAALPSHNNPPPPTLTEVVTTLRTLGKTELPKQLARWLDELDETGRWALLKLVTGAMRIGVSARLAKTAAAALGNKDAHEVELMWPGLTPPYLDLFAWLEGTGDKPVNRDPTPFRPVMLAHAIEDADFANLDPADFIAEWKWDGIRVQAVVGPRRTWTHAGAAVFAQRRGHHQELSGPDAVAAFARCDRRRIAGAARGRVQTFNVLQQRLNRKVVSPKLIKEYPIHLRAYDLLADDEADLRELTFVERRARLETFIKKLDDPRIDLSPTVAFDSWDALTAARADPASAGAGEDAEAVEGVMLKRRDALYLPGRPKGQWWKWKRDPHLIDAVLMYAQRGHGKRSSYYSDYTFGVWTDRTANWCRSARPISASPTRSCCRSTVSSAATPPKNSDPCAMSCTSRTRAWCWKSPSRGWRARRGTNPASRCGFRASTGCAGTSRHARPTGWRRWSGC